jgi:hypothetical protein
MARTMMRVMKRTMTRARKRGRWKIIGHFAPPNPFSSQERARHNDLYRR